MATGDSQDDVQYVRTLSKQSTTKNVTTEENNNCSEEKDLQTIFENLTTADETEMEEDVSVLMKFLPVDALFSNVTFQLVGSMDADLISWTTYLIESNGGRVLANDAKYKVTTPVVHADLLPDDTVGQAVVINTFLIEDCIDEDCLVEIEIYHQPIKFQNSQIFAGCVVSFSGIQGRLRDFLKYLVDHLGGKQQEFFSRKMVEAKDVYPSTHLVCPEAEGRKYEKAVKWGVPVVNAEWIIASATSSTRLKETDFGIFRPPGDQTLSAPASFSSITFDAPTPVQVFCA
jgi:NAD-dependent DNA ligase